VSTTIEPLGAALAAKARPSLARATLQGVVLCAAYYLGTLLGYVALFPSSYISVIWPPNAVLVAALLLSPTRRWVWILLIVLPVHELAQLRNDVGLATATVYYVFDCILVTTTALAMRRFGLDDLTLRDLRKTLTFLAVATSAAAIGSLAWSPLIVGLWAGGEMWSAWSLVFLSNLLPFVVALPSLVPAANRGIRIVKGTPPERYVEFSALIAGLLAAGLGIFGFETPAVAKLPALLYLPLPFLLWAAVRFGSAGLSVAFSIFTLIVVMNAVGGTGPFVMQSAAGNVLWIQAFLLALYVPLLVLAAEVQERADKEKALKASETRYRAVVEDQSELICRFLPDGTYTFVNDAYCRYFGTSREELIGRSFWRFIPPQEHQAGRDFLASITPEHPIGTREHEVIHSSGELRWQQWMDRGLFDEHGRIIEYQAVGRDITERKHLEDAMRGLAHAERLALVGELTGSIVHEIAQPLTAILANAEAAGLELRSRSPSLDEVRTMLNDIRLDDQRAAEILKRMRSWLRKREPVMSTFRVDELVADVFALVRAEARQRRVTLEAASGPTVEIHGDRVQLQQVLLNLILNGMDAMADAPEEQRRLVVSFYRDSGERVSVSVRDRGHGIPADRLLHVFESFYTTKAQGMGLGLAIARSIVELHGGEIWAENNPAGGATLRFTLPNAAAEAARGD
jgi:two-component system, LuxR family, sensor kinase FixL